MIPLERVCARQQESNAVKSCEECTFGIKCGKYWYCKSKGKLVHPFQAYRYDGGRCEVAKPKEEAR